MAMEEMIMDEKEKYFKIFNMLDNDDFLSKCLNISPEEIIVLAIAKSVGIPSEILSKVNFLYEIISALEGVYNSLGIYRWFHRKRVLLDNKASIDILVGDWRPEDENPQKVLELAERLLYGQIAS